ncbi:MAG: hypothetical protein KDI51_09660, partial [Xanthomonadales bacterium]|nr:hypothetical protein [Xanthomonadales bacterium]
MIRPHARQPTDPVYRPLRIYTRDPSLKRSDGAETTVQVPYEPLPEIEAHQQSDDKSPRATDFEFRELLAGNLLSVGVEIPGGSEASWLEQPANSCSLDVASHAMQGGYPPATSCPRFAAQMAYAVGMLTYEHFRRALGRDPTWRDPARKLRLVVRTLRLKQGQDGPRDRSDLLNAYYDPGCQEIFFGSFGAAASAPGRSQPGARVHTGLSHDVIVHEVVHALLDGLKPHLLLPTSPDVLAFHEGFADLIALFMHFGHSEIVRRALTDRGGRLDSKLLTDLAAQFGQTTHGGHDALRCGITDQQDPESEVPSAFRYAGYLEPHTLGSVLVSAVFEAFRVVYRRKTKRLRQLASGMRSLGRGLPEELLVMMADKASDLAQQFLNILIRALDYLPPVDITFGDYLR